MHLLKSKEIKKAKQDQISKEATFALKVRDATEKERRKMNKAKSFFVEETLKIEGQFAEFVNGIEQKRNVLKNEVTILENRRKEILKPVDTIIKDAKDMAKESKVEKEKLEKELDDVKIREIHVNEREIKLDNDLKKMQNRDTMLDKDTERLKVKKEKLTKEEEIFSNRKDKEEELIRQEKLEIVKDKKLIKQKELEVKKGTEFNEKENDKIGKEWRKITDQRATLERAFKRIKK